MGDTNSPHTLTPDNAGCWIDCAEGTYVGQRIIGIAKQYGFKIKPEDEKYVTFSEALLQDDGAEQHQWLADEAEEYMQELAPEGFYFGSSDQGDWGLWELNDEEAG